MRERYLPDGFFSENGYSTHHVQTAMREGWQALTRATLGAADVTSPRSLCLILR
jgi:hypothetical protein